MKYALALILGILLGAFGQSYYQSLEVTRPIAPFSDSLSQTSAALTECEQFNPFSKAVNDIGSIPYNAAYDNCYDHSKQMAQELATDGIQSSIFVNKDRTHAWLAVWIEATTGHFISPQQAQEPLYSQLIEIRNGINPTDVECYQNK